MSEKSKEESNFDEDDNNSIPLADCDAQDSPRSKTSETSSSEPKCRSLDDQLMVRGLCLDEQDFIQDEVEEKARLIAQVLELQNTLEDLTSRVDTVKEENLKLRSENSVLGQYIENLMQVSTVFQPASSQSKELKVDDLDDPKSGHVRPTANTSLGSVIRSCARAKSMQTGKSSSKAKS